MTTSGRFGPEVAPPTAAPAPAPTTAPTGPPTTAPPTAPAVAPAAAPGSGARASVGRAKRAAAEARARIELRMVTLLMFQMLGKRDAAKPVPPHDRQGSRSRPVGDQPCPRPELLGLALELAAGGEDVAAARGAHRRGVAGPEHDLGKALDALPVRALVLRAGPGVERDQVDLRRQ